MNETSDSLGQNRVTCGVATLLDNGESNAQLRDLVIGVSVWNGILSCTSIGMNILLIKALGLGESSVAPAKTLIFAMAVANLVIASLVQPLFIATMLSQVNANMKNCLVEHTFNFFGYVLSPILIVTMTMMACDRAAVVYLSLRYKIVVTNSKYRTIILVLTGAAVLISGLYTAEVLSRQAFLLITVIGLALCLGTIVASYIYLGNYIFFSRNRTFSNTKTDLYSLRQDRVRKRRLITITLLVTFALVCFIPQGLLLTIRSRLNKMHTIFMYDIIADTIGFSIGTINPICFFIRSGDQLKKARYELSRRRKAVNAAFEHHDAQGQSSMQPIHLATTVNMGLKEGHQPTIMASTFV